MRFWQSMSVFGLLSFSRNTGRFLRMEFSWIRRGIVENAAVEVGASREGENYVGLRSDYHFTKTGVICMIC